MKHIPRVVWWGLAAVVGLVIVLTLGAWALETNPPVKQEPPWDSPQTKALAQRACYDCHSNETVWNAYTRLPVGSWLAVFDTLRGRRHLNFSEWGTTRIGGDRGEGVGDVAEVIADGSMPPALYTTIHPEAALSAAERQQLSDGLQKSLK